MKLLVRLFPVGALVLLFAAAPAADAREIDLQCFTNATGSPAADFATAAVVGNYQSNSGGTTLDAQTFEFLDSADREIVCRTILPADYDKDSTTIPSVKLYGWLANCVECLSTCGGIGCSSTTGKVEFEVSSRRYEDTSGVQASWVAGGSDTATQSCEASICNGGSGWREGKVHLFEADATDDASSWLPGDLVYIRILRDTSISDNLGETFALGAVSLDFPTN